MKKLLLVTMFSLTSTVLIASESGFIVDGKSYVTFKDGKKTGQTFEEFLKNKEKKNDNTNGRNISSVEPGRNVILFYQEDGYARCYYNGLWGDATNSNYGESGQYINAKTSGFQLSCVPKR